MAALAELASLLTDRASAATLYDLLLPYASRNVVVGVPICFGSAAIYLGCLATTLERWQAAAQHFEDALVMNTRLGALPFLARTQVFYAVMLLQRNQDADREQALRLLEQAQSTAEKLGMVALIERVRQVQVNASPRRPAPPYPAGLTPAKVKSCA